MGTTQSSSTQAARRQRSWRQQKQHQMDAADDALRPRRASACTSALERSGAARIDLLHELTPLGVLRRQELSGSSTSALSDLDGGIPLKFQDPLRDNLMMLPSALDPRGRKIRRITTDVVDTEEQLLLVKRRACAAKAIALHSESPLDRSATSSMSSLSNELDAPPMSPQDFEYLKVIGVGGMGRVVLVRNRRDDKLYAMKVVDKSRVKENNQSDMVLSERDVLGGTNHHSLVHLHWAFQTRRNLYLVMDYCPGGELSCHLQAADRFDKEVAVFYAAELVLALEHLHRHGIVYRDLKPENILLTAQGHLKLVDFGLSKFGITEATAGASTICGSYEYLAPEVFENKGYGSAVDWWSFGAVLYEMLTGLPPWYHENHHVMRECILTKPLAFPSYVSEEARDLLRRLLTQDPAKRLGSREDSQEIRRHAFFRHLDWQMVTFREIVPPIQPCESDDVIENATNFDIEFTRLSVSSVDSCASSGRGDEFAGFNFEPPPAPRIHYGYSRDVHAYGHSGVCA